MKHEQFTEGQPAPSGPLSTIPGMTYVSPLPPTRQISKLPLALGLVALVFAVVAGTALVMRLSAQDSLSNADILLSAVENNLQTGSYRQDTVYSNTTYTQLSDVSLITSPRINGYLVTNVTGRSSQISTYADSRNAYFKYVSADPGLVPTKAVGQWIGLRQNSPAPASAPDQLLQLTDPAFQLLGPFVVGQFSSDQRQALVKQWSTAPVLSFSDKAVKSASVEGKDVLVYSVTYNNDNLKAYARVVAGYMGMKDSSVQLTLSALDNYRTNTVYVDPIAKRILKVEYTTSTGQVVIAFSGFGTTPVADEPKAVFQFGELLPAPRL